MAYVDEGQGDSFVFQHGNPTSSYVWRNIFPHLEGTGRLVACDLIGMGESDKLEGIDPKRYDYEVHREFLFELWDSLDLGNRITLVLDDWGVILGLDWAHRNSHRIKAIVHMEGVVAPYEWSDIPEVSHPFFKAVRSELGEKMVLEENMFIEQRLPSAILRKFLPEEISVYQKPYLSKGEDRRPTLSFPRNLPIEGEPKAVVEAMYSYLPWMQENEIPKLFVNGDPGAIATGRVRELMRTWKNQKEITVKGRKILQEDSPDEIGMAIKEFTRNLEQE